MIKTIKSTLPGGVLVESSEGPNGLIVLVGIGVNIRWTEGG